MQFLRVSRRKNRIFSPEGPFFLVLYMIVYQSALISKKLLCPKNFLVTRLHLAFNFAWNIYPFNWVSYKKLIKSVNKKFCFYKIRVEAWKPSMKWTTYRVLLHRSSHRRCSVRKDVLKSLAKFTGKHLRQSLFFNKVAGWGHFIEKDTLAQVFSCEFCEISKNTFFTEHLWTTASVYNTEVSPFYQNDVKLRFFHHMRNALIIEQDIWW